MSRDCKNKWPIAVAAVVMLGLAWRDNDLSAWKGLSAEELIPVLSTAAVIFLLKTGILSVLLLGVKKLREWMERSRNAPK